MPTGQKAADYTHNVTGKTPEVVHTTLQNCHFTDSMCCAHYQEQEPSQPGELQGKELRLMFGMPSRDNLLRMLHITNFNQLQLVLTGVDTVYSKWGSPPVGGIQIRRWQGAYHVGRANSEEQERVVTTMKLTPHCAIPGGWLPHFTSVTTDNIYDGGYKTGVSLYTNCGDVKQPHHSTSHQLLRSKLGVLYVSSVNCRSSYSCGCGDQGCKNCGEQGALEPLSYILGTLGEEQRTARWRVVLIQQIVQTNNLPLDIAKCVFNYMPRPGTLESMQAHPVCKCPVCSEFSARCIREIEDKSYTMRLTAARAAIRLQLQPTPAASLMVLGNGTSDDSDSDDDFDHEKLAQWRGRRGARAKQSAIAKVQSKAPLPKCSKTRDEQDEAEEVALAISRVKKDLKRTDEVECSRRMRSLLEAADDECGVVLGAAADREPGIIGTEPGVMPAPAAEPIGSLLAFPSPGQLHTDHKSADDSCPAPAKRR